MRCNVVDGGCDECIGGMPTHMHMLCLPVPAPPALCPPPFPHPHRPPTPPPPPPPALQLLLYQERYPGLEFDPAQWPAKLIRKEHR